jgi:hypothetical protein
MECREKRSRKNGRCEVVPKASSADVDGVGAGDSGVVDNKSWWTSAGCRIVAEDLVDEIHSHLYLFLLRRSVCTNALLLHYDYHLSDPTALPFLSMLLFGQDSAVELPRKTSTLILI